MAQSFMEKISIRENNDYCHKAMLYGHDMKKHLLIPVNENQEKIELSQEDEQLMSGSADSYLEGLRNGRR